MATSADNHGHSSGTPGSRRNSEQAVFPDRGRGADHGDQGVCAAVLGDGVPDAEAEEIGTNQRLYRRKDVEMVLEIKRLLYEQRFTIEGARTYLENRRHAPKAAAKAPGEAGARQGMLFAAEAAVVERARQGLGGVRAELKSILELLS